MIIPAIRNWYPISRNTPGCHDAEGLSRRTGRYLPGRNVLVGHRDGLSDVAVGSDAGYCDSGFANSSVPASTGTSIAGS